MMIGKPHPPDNRDIRRPARSGDLCILLVPAEENSVQRLQAHQHVLQTIYGGHPVKPVHVTCQRFAPVNGASLRDFTGTLVARLDDFRPFSITASGFQTLYSQYRGNHILKWQIAVTESLKRFSALVEETIRDQGYASLYAPGWVSTLVTALENIHTPQTDHSLAELTIPTPLFVASSVIISQINGKNDYETLEHIKLPTK